MKRLLLLFAVAMMLASCNNKAEDLDGSIATAEPDLEVGFTASIASSTRVADDAFSEGDVILVQAFEDGVAFESQATYTYDGADFSSEGAIVRTSAEQELSYIAAYPSTLNDFGQTFEFAVESDQATGDNLEMSDLLVAIEAASTSTTPELLFYHAMSSLVIDFVFTGDNAADLLGGTLTVYGQATAAIDLSGEVYSAVAAGYPSVGLTPSGSSADGFTTIFAPQSIEEGSVVALYTVGDKTYTWTSNNSLNFNSAIRYTYAWTINADNEEPTYNGEVSYIGEINGWNDVELTDDLYFDVTFDYDNELIADSVVLVKEGEFVTAPEANPVKEGYTFEGWVDAANEPFDFTNTPITAETTITASWALDYDDSWHIITSEADLQAFRIVVNGGTTAAKAVLTKDIALSEASWTPIGTSTNPFAGTFDGGNHTIYGLKISANTAYQGLFGALGGGASIANCTISDLDILTTYNTTTTSGTYGTIGAFAGGVVSSADTVYLTNLTVEDGTIQGGCMVGGIIGATSGYNALGVGLAAIITDCTIEEDVTITKTGNNYLGGITSTVKSYSVITNCQNKGALISTGGIINGGILGAGQYSQIIGCSNVGSVTSSGNAYGGIMGVPGSNMVFVGCYNTGYVGGSSTTADNAGGIAGQLSSGGLELYACYSAGTIVAAEKGGQLLGSFAGGASGSTVGEPYAIIEDCFAVGTAIGSNSAATAGYDWYDDIATGTIEELNAYVTTMNANATFSATDYYYTEGGDDDTPPSISYAPSTFN